MTSITLRVLAGNILFRKSGQCHSFFSSINIKVLQCPYLNLMEVDVQGIDRVRPDNVVTKKEGKGKSVKSSSKNERKKKQSSSIYS